MARDHYVRQIPKLNPPTKGKISWDFSKLDADIIPFLEWSKGHQSILNLTGIRYWMFKTGRPVPQSDIPDDPNLRYKYWEDTKELVDPTGKALGEYFARIVAGIHKAGSRTRTADITTRVIITNCPGGGCVFRPMPGR